MKKTILLTGILVLSVSLTFAQFAEKGSMLFNGSISYYGGKEKTEFSGSGSSEVKISSMSFSPMFQYFVINNLAVGAMLQASTDITKYDSGDKDTYTDLTFGPVVRYYIWQALFAQAYYGFGSGKYKSTGQSTFESKTNVTEWVLSAGYSVRITDTVLFDPMIGYWVNTQKDDADGASKTIRSQFCIQLGFSILINK